MRRYALTLFIAALLVGLAGIAIIARDALAAAAQRRPKNAQ